MRLSINTVVEPIISKISDVLSGDITNLVPKNYAMYIGFATKTPEKQQLLDFVHKVMGHKENFTEYCHHLTQFWIGPKRDFRKFPCYSNFKTVIASIECLVVRVSDGAAAFRISKVSSHDLKWNGWGVPPINNTIETQEHPHITAYLPNNLPAMASRQFVGKNDEEVFVFPFNKDIELTCVWF